MKTDELTTLAIGWLRESFPEAIVIREMNVGSYGDARLDAAAIDPTKGIIGVEVKGEADKPDRLKLQIPRYSMVAQQMWLLADKKIRTKCHKAAQGSGWGLLTMEPTGKSLFTNGYTYRDGVFNAPYALLEPLWRQELIGIIKRRGIECRKRVHDMQLALVKTLPMPEIRTLMIDTLYRRDWLSMPQMTGRIWMPEEYAEIIARKYA